MALYGKIRAPRESSGEVKVKPSSNKRTLHFLRRPPRTATAVEWMNSMDLRRGTKCVVDGRGREVRLCESTGAQRIVSGSQMSGKGQSSQKDSVQQLNI